MSVEQIQALADGLATRLGRAVLVDDRNLRLVAASEDFGDADPARVWSLLHRRTRPVSGDTILPRLPGLEDRDDRRYFGMVIRPNCFLSLLPDHVIVHRFEPVSPELTKVVCEWLFPPETVAAHDIGDAVEL